MGLLGGEGWGWEGVGITASDRSTSVWFVPLTKLREMVRTGKPGVLWSMGLQSRTRLHEQQPCCWETLLCNQDDTWLFSLISGSSGLYLPSTQNDQLSIPISVFCPHVLISISLFSVSWDSLQKKKCLRYFTLALLTPRMSLSAWIYRTSEFQATRKVLLFMAQSTREWEQMLKSESHSATNTMAPFCPQGSGPCNLTKPMSGPYML